jgi:hypothetical protein
MQQRSAMLFDEEGTRRGASFFRGRNMRIKERLSGGLPTTIAILSVLVCLNTAVAVPGGRKNPKTQATQAAINSVFGKVLKSNTDGSNLNSSSNQSPALTHDQFEKLTALSNKFSSLNKLKEDQRDFNRWLSRLDYLVDAGKGWSEVRPKFDEIMGGRYPWLTKDLLARFDAAKFDDWESFEDSVVQHLLGASSDYMKQEQDRGIAEMLQKLNKLDIRPTAISSEGSRYYLGPELDQSVRFRESPSKDGTITTVMDKWIAIAPEDLPLLMKAIKGHMQEPVRLKAASVAVGNHIIEFNDPNNSVKIEKDVDGYFVVTMINQEDQAAQAHISNPITEVNK